MKKYIFLSLLMSAGILQAQPLNGGLSFLNPQLINPAYTAISNRLIAGTTYKSQWTNLEDHPSSMAAFVSSTLLEDYVGGGIAVIQDRIGFLTSTTSHLMSAYSIGNSEYKIAVGLQIGIIRQRIDYGKLFLDPTAADDPEFQSGNPSVKLNFGAGLAFVNDFLTVGVAVPNMDQPVISNGESPVSGSRRELCIQSTGYFVMEQGVIFRPTLLLNIQGKKSISASMGLNWTAREIITIGLHSRDFKLAGGLLGVNAGRGLQVVYNFETPLNPTMLMSYNTHEIMLKYQGILLPFHSRKFDQF